MVCSVVHESVWCVGVQSLFSLVLRFEGDARAKSRPARLTPPFPPNHRGFFRRYLFRYPSAWDC